ncbi:pseudouridine synthase A-like protein, putative [Bodo saltans]|uniref:tRNA pseudouridine synthase n=1 Tax=Bodo saltans TaxID=75058 RepID=A0A0S4JB03_BODSA|nr:pseudouridine synthase A-like protein, putative [Bodo saltans]|eukprot:CUG87245.1 pseudouridine synthase A-like protein, putative [Bodo saltans]
MDSDPSQKKPPKKDYSTFKPKKAWREFDINKYPKRHVVLRLAYHGHRFDGLAKQDHTTNTVEGFVVEALKRVRLIGPDGPEKFSRCGRTDKGVSALGNAFSLLVRASTDDAKPLDYCDMLNHVLPATIRIVAWSFVADTFDARFSCTSRVYRYYFMNRGLDLEKMRAGATHLVGSHSFRNFCKLDVVNVDNFVRNIFNVRIVPSEEAPELISFCEIHGNAFLYHQIRCTMSVLFLVGRGLESPDVVKELLERGDAKPIYPLADDSPLVLWNCIFPAQEVSWQCSEEARDLMLMELQDIATALIIRGVAAADMRRQVKEWGSEQQQSAAAAAPSDAVVVAGATTTDVTLSSSSPSVSESTCSWDATGCDWTSDHFQPLMQKRERDAHMQKKLERTGANAYIKLLDREVEATYGERVDCLSVTKKARHDVNQSKKRPRGTDETSA